MTNFTHDGKLYVDDALPVIYHATPEMKAKLEDFYGVEFEAPPVKPTSREIIQAMLERGDEYVPCWVSNSREPVCFDKWTFIYKVANGYYFDVEDTRWAYATPLDPRTDTKITELPE